MKMSRGREHYKYKSPRDINTHLKKELEDLARIFEINWERYGTSWKQRDAPWLLHRLQHEVFELAALIIENPSETHKPGKKRHEALDIANLALMIANNHPTQLKSIQEKRK